MGWFPRFARGGPAARIRPSDSAACVDSVEHSLGSASVTRRSSTSSFSPRSSDRAQLDAGARDVDTYLVRAGLSLGRAPKLSRRSCCRARCRTSLPACASASASVDGARRQEMRSERAQPMINNARRYSAATRFCRAWCSSASWACRSTSPGASSRVDHAVAPRAIAMPQVSVTNVSKVRLDQG